MLTRAASFLGIANAGRALAFAFSLAALTAAAGFAAGKSWQTGVEARTDLAELEEVLDAQREQLGLLRSVATRFSAARESQRVFHTEQRQRLLDWLLVPNAVDGCRIGDDGLRMWNDANQGAAAGAAAAGPSGAVSPPATGAGRLRQDAGREPRDGDATARRLRVAPGGAGGVGADGGRARD